MSNDGTRLLPETLARIDRYLDDESNMNRFAEQGRLIHRVFAEDRGGRDNISSQVRNLQQATTSAVRMSDIEDFLKNQMGKSTGAAETLASGWTGQRSAGRTGPAAPGGARIGRGQSPP